MPLVSIIVPAYCAEKYLSRCIDSLLAQTYPNVECIIVDDGSPDKCGDIIDSYAAKDRRVRPIHQTNGGVSAARAAGVRSAEGEFVTFVDADDYIAPDMIKTMLSYCGEDIDIVVLDSHECSEMTMEQYCVQLLSFRLLAVWGKLYRKYLLDDYVITVPRFFNIGEDFLFQLRLLHNIRGKIYSRNEHKYFYNTDNPMSVQRAHRSSYEYERSMMNEVGTIVSGLPCSPDITQAYFKWRMAYLGGMMGLHYPVRRDEEWVTRLISESKKQVLSRRQRFTLAAVNRPILRYVLVLEKVAKRRARSFLRVFGRY